MNTDPMVAFLLSGNAHAYYGLLGVIAVAAILLFTLRIAWAGVILALGAAVFVDLWVNGYLH